MLLDTNVLSEPLRERPDPAAMAQLEHGAQRARLEASGHCPAFVDGHIAAIAATQALVLVTRNTADFAAFEGPEVRNWFSQP